MAARSSPTTTARSSRMPRARKVAASGSRLRSCTLPLNSSFPTSTSAAVAVARVGRAISSRETRSVGLDLPNYGLALRIDAEQLLDATLGPIQDLLRALGERHAFLEQGDRFFERLLPLLETLDDFSEPRD